MNSIVGRNVLSCCQRYSTNIDSVIAFRFNIENIDRVANIASDYAPANDIIALFFILFYNIFLFFLFLSSSEFILNVS